MSANAKLGASRSVIESGPWAWPLHGLRHPPDGETNGWYLWTGDLSDDPEFFLPWHVNHALERCPALSPILDMPPGTRFVFAPDHLDVWHDDSLTAI